MRQRLALLSLATTALVVISLVVPLGLLVRRQAFDAARAEAEREAQSVASLVALSLAVGTSEASVSDAIGDLTLGTVVVIGETLIGDPRTGQGTLIEPAIDQVSALADEVPGGWEIAVPVVGRDDVAVVDVFVTDEEMTEGVTTAWALLALLAFILVGAATLIADRLGKRLVVPIAELSASARRLAEGDLEARVVPSDPPEVRAVGEAFNYLADRLDDLLIEERESMADLSHRLRTPLTSLRLQAERIRDDSERETLLAEVDRMERSVTNLIEMARSPAAHHPQVSFVDEIVERRLSFWRVSASEQRRQVVTDLGAPGASVQLSSEHLETIIDVLVENVFLHTEPGTGFRVATGLDATGAPWIRVADEGPGFGSGGPPMERGESGKHSTGLGLDIVRKHARAAGGSIDAGDRPGGGAVVTVTLG